MPVVVPQPLQSGQERSIPEVSKISFFHPRKILKILKEALNSNIISNFTSATSPQLISQFKVQPGLTHFKLQQDQKLCILFENLQHIHFCMNALSSVT